MSSKPSHSLKNKRTCRSRPTFIPIASAPAHADAKRPARDMPQIQYSEKYYDDIYEYRWVNHVASRVGAARIDSKRCLVKRCDGRDTCGLTDE